MNTVAGVHLSIRELLHFWSLLWTTNVLLDEGQKDTMLTHLLGVWKGNPQHGTSYEHEGSHPASGNGGAEIHTGVVAFDVNQDDKLDGQDLYVVGVANGTHRVTDAIVRAYNDSWHALP